MLGSIDLGESILEQTPQPYGPLLPGEDESIYPPELTSMMHVRQRPPGVVPSSLDVVESFFGEELNERSIEGMVQAVINLQPDAALELSERIYNVVNCTFRALGRRYEGSHFSKFLPPARSETVGAGYEYLTQANIHIPESTLQ